MRKLIRADGAEHDLPARLSMPQIRALIRCHALDIVHLPLMGAPLHVMLADGADDKPVNAAATDLYREHCDPGSTHLIYGDAVIVPDSDFA